MMSLTCDLMADLGFVIGGMYVLLALMDEKKLTVLLMTASHSLSFSLSIRAISKSCGDFALRLARFSPCPSSISD